ncbi:MAG: ribosomal protein S18-alanine N-acetyltransferase [Gammaproteobacteria bacterium]|nr:ribosomal protein S18-alanine N-acetyltransferase [Gammaproteobacteria bacterium]
MAARSDELLGTRAMRATDLHRIIGIERRCYHFPWGETAFLDSMAVGYICRVLTLGHQVVGYVIVSSGAGEAHLLNISIDPEWQGRGFGRQLVHLARESAREAGAEILLLEVRPSNQIALQLYARTGFHQIGRRSNYYRAVEGREDAIILSCPL